MIVMAALAAEVVVSLVALSLSVWDNFKLRKLIQKLEREE